MSQQPGEDVQGGGGGPMCLWVIETLIKPCRIWAHRGHLAKVVSLLRRGGSHTEVFQEGMRGKWDEKWEQ